MLNESANQNKTDVKPSESIASAASKPASPLPPLQDKHGRTFDYVRIAVIE